MHDFASSLPAPLVRAEYAPYTVTDYLGWQRDGSLTLRPKFQRGAVWKAKDKTLLIDSMIRGYPIPAVILQRQVDLATSAITRRVVDGQQRLRTILAFIDPSSLSDATPDDNFQYRIPGSKAADRGYTFADLPDPLRRQLLATPIGTILLDESTEDAAVLEVYDRLNSSGAMLGNQELRFAKRQGPFSDVCYQLARGNQSRWTEWRILKEAEISRMREVELTSELVLLILDGIEKTGKREIDTAYSDRDLTDAEIDYVTRVFQAAMDLLDAFYGSPGDPDKAKSFRTRAWFYSSFSLALHQLDCIDDDGRRTHPLFEEISTGLEFRPSRSDRVELAGQLSRALVHYPAERHDNADLARSVTGAASDRQARMVRFNYLRRAEQR